MLTDSTPIVEKYRASWILESRFTSA